jgi:hypothetical protein
VQKLLGAGPNVSGGANHFWGLRPPPQKIRAWTLCVRPTRKNRQGNAQYAIAHILAQTVKKMEMALDNSLLKVWFCGQKKMIKKLFVMHTRK